MGALYELEAGKPSTVGGKTLSYTHKPANYSTEDIERLVEAAHEAVANDWVPSLDVLGECNCEQCQAADEKLRRFYAALSNFPKETE